MPLTPFPGNQERLRELGELPPLRCLGLPLQGSPETTLREETFVHCTRTGKESVGESWAHSLSVRLSVCGRWSYSPPQLPQVRSRAPRTQLCSPDQGTSSSFEGPPL